MPLRSTQRWLQTAIVSPEAPKSAGRHVAASPTMEPAQRIGIYRDLYPARLVEALKVDYPLLHRYLGARVFTELALLYGQKRPSRSFTLNAFGAGLPEFIARIDGLRRRDFVEDLAHFERACAEVFHEKQADPLSSAQIAAVPGEAWMNVKLLPIPALRLLALRYPVHRYAAGESGIRAKSTWLVVYRRHYEVAWLPLTGNSYSVLAELCRGKSLGRALAGVPCATQDWFRDWTAAGLFCAVRLK